MLGAGGQRARGAGHFAGQVVEDHRLADVRAADDGHDQQRRQVELRQQLVPQQFEPLLSRRRRHAHLGRLRLQRGQCSIEPLHPGGKGAVGWHATHSHGNDTPAFFPVVKRLLEENCKGWTFTCRVEHVAQPDEVIVLHIAPRQCEPPRRGNTGSSRQACADRLCGRESPTTLARSPQAVLDQPRGLSQTPPVRQRRFPSENLPAKPNRKEPVGESSGDGRNRRLSGDRRRLRQAWFAFLPAQFNTILIVHLTARKPLLRSAQHQGHRLAVRTNG